MQAPYTPIRPPHTNTRPFGPGHGSWLLRADANVAWDDPDALDDAHGLAVTVRGERATVAAGETVEVEVEVRWDGAGPLWMPTLTVDLAPGLVPLPGSLRVDPPNPPVLHWEQNAERMTLYYWCLPAGSVSTVTVPMIARWPGTVQAAAAHVWSYYDPDTEARGAPLWIRTERAP